MCKRKQQDSTEINRVGASDTIMPEIDEGSGPNLVDSESIAGYLAQAAAELEAIARASKLRLVAHFFAMASEEAESQTRLVGAQPTLH